MQQALFEVNAANPLFYLAVSGTLLLVAVCASWFPARRATRIDPVRALRMEWSLFGAPGVGVLVATGTQWHARASMARERNARTGDLHPSRMPLREWRSDGHRRRSRRPPLPPPPPPPLPPALETTIAVSTFPPPPIVMVWPAVKPAALATMIVVVPAAASAPAVVAPGVPTVAITAVSASAPVSTTIA